jgi:hypothetical protein
MRLNQAQLRNLNAVENEPLANPILKKLSHLENLLKNLPVPQMLKIEKQIYDDSNVLGRLGRLEKIISQLAAEKPATYVFDITHNANGSLAKIVATPVKD